MNILSVRKKVVNRERNLPDSLLVFWWMGAVIWRNFVDAVVVVGGAFTCQEDGRL